MTEGRSLAKVERELLDEYAWRLEGKHPSGATMGAALTELVRMTAERVWRMECEVEFLKTRLQMLESNVYQQTGE